MLPAPVPALRHHGRRSGPRRRPASRSGPRRPPARRSPPAPDERFRAVLALLLAALAALALASPPTARANPLAAGADVDPHVPGWSPDLGIAVRYQPPVQGRVLRPFDPPTTAFGAGHRGVDLDVGVGAPIRAAAPGMVRFAGPVAGRRWVSIAHTDGHLTTYGPLQGLRVARGASVSGGEVLGALDAGGHGPGGRDHGLHWGARDRTGTYIDPLSLLGGDDRRPSLVGEGAWRGTDHRVRAYEPWEGGRAAGVLVGGSPTAARPGFAVPPNPNHLILVPGLAASSASQVLDTAHLGYDPRSVTAFSYAGRVDVDGDGADEVDPRRDQLPYGPEHTWPGPGPAAALLADQLRAQAAREPGRAVDLIGYSMGGLVILHYLLEHHDPYDTSLPPIGHVVTIASPLRGSDLAVVAEVLGDDVLLGPVAEEVGRHLGPAGQRLPLDAPAIGQVASGSDATQRLARAWDRALEAGAAGPLATGTRVLTIGGSRDLVVTPHRTRHPAGHDSAHGFGGTVDALSGVIPTTDAPVVDHRVLPGGHGSVLETEAVREVTWRFLAGEEVITSPGHAGTVIGGELGNLGATAARVLHLWGMWQMPAIRRPGATPLP